MWVETIRTECPVRKRSSTERWRGKDKTAALTRQTADGSCQSWTPGSPAVPWLWFIFSTPSSGWDFLAAENHKCLYSVHQSYYEAALETQEEEKEEWCSVGSVPWGLVRRAMQTVGEVAAMMFGITQELFHVYNAVIGTHLFYLKWHDRNKDL